MLFRPYRSVQIRLDPNAVRADSPEVTQRLNRIQDNYQLLESLFARVEAMLPESSLNGSGGGEPKLKKSPTPQTLATIQRQRPRNVKPR